MEFVGTSRRANLARHVCQQLLSTSEGESLFEHATNSNRLLAPTRNVSRVQPRLGPRALNIQAGDHLDLDRNDGSVLPYVYVRMLGHGGNASVEEVCDINTGSIYARKIIKNVYDRNIEEAKRRILNEVRIMQRLAPHRHIVRVHATYNKGRELAIILEPVADGGDLAEFLQNYRDQGFCWSGNAISSENTYQNQILRKAFGCLASALAFMHQQTIRHKDIKPQNILVHQGKVLYADFGLSYDFGDTGRSTTTGYPQGITRRYCAPEVADYGSRNSKSDVFSLGCVFTEIYLTLVNDTSCDRLYEQPYHEILRSHPDGLPLPIPSVDSGKELPWLSDFIISKMVQKDPTLRPSSDTVAYMFSQAPYDALCPSCYQDWQAILASRAGRYP
jgi:serine/threonine protein kinase